MITPADFMRFPSEDRAVALDTFREHLARLLLAEAAMVIRQKQPGAAWIRIRFPSDVMSGLRGTAELISIRDLGGHILGGIGKEHADTANTLLGDVNRVCPGLLGRPDPDRSSVARVDLPATPDDV
jgi:hypothetical protein